MKGSLPLGGGRPTQSNGKPARQEGGRKLLQPEDARQRAVEALRRVFGYEAFRSEQQRAILAALQGRDSFVLMPTGGGKSLCYTIPALVLQGQLVLVVSPLIALMQDQVAGLHSRGIAAAYLSSAIPSAQRKALLTCLENNLSTEGLRLPLQKTGSKGPSDTSKLRMLYVTPELLATDHFQATVSLLVSRHQLGLLAVDEAHCISSWGHDFRPKYKQLRALDRILGGKERHIPIMALTATATQKVQDDITEQLVLRQPLVLPSSFNRPNITYSVHLLDVSEQQHKMQKQASSGSAAAANATLLLPDQPQISNKEAFVRFVQEQKAAGVPLVTSGQHRAQAQVVKQEGQQAAADPKMHQQQTHHVQQQEQQGNEVVNSHLPEDMRQLSRLLAQHLGPSGDKARGCAVVYVHRRADADDVVSQISRQAQWRSLRCAAYHAGMADKDRASVMQRWQEKNLDLVAATIAFGMGIDRADVRLVVHWCVPLAVEGYYQESGRAGRDGLPAHAALFYTDADRKRIDWILQKEAGKRQASKHTDKKPKLDATVKQQAFSAVVSYATQAACRRATLLAHFGEVLPAGACEGCDYCSNPSAVESAVSSLAVVLASRPYRCSGEGGSSLVDQASNGWASRRADTGTYGYDMIDSRESEDEDEVSGSDSDEETDEGTRAAEAAADAARRLAAAAAQARNGAGATSKTLHAGNQQSQLSGPAAKQLVASGPTAARGRSSMPGTSSNRARAATVPSHNVSRSSYSTSNRNETGGTGSGGLADDTYFNIMLKAEHNYDRAQKKQGGKGSFLALLNKG